MKLIYLINLNILHIKNKYLFIDIRGKYNNDSQLICNGNTINLIQISIINKWTEKIKIIIQITDNYAIIYFI
jgi:hypothetical protein